jgi:ElaB/YqjD/DUF883 family membrane-anchored ribosome-binding protein
MAEDTFKPMTDKDVAPALADPLAATDAFQPADPLKATDSDGGDPISSAAGSTGGQDKEESSSPRQTISDNVTKLKSEAGDRARTFADQGKAKATGALDQLVSMLNDAAGQVDDKLGAQYGQYARSAADQVQGFSSSLNDRSVEELLDDARGLVRKSPAAAIGVAAAVGFVAARLLSAGLDQRDVDQRDSDQRNRA